MFNFKSNLAISFCGIFSIASTFVSQPSEAKNSDRNQAPRVEMKCYVELVGGMHTIYRTVLPNNKLAGLAVHLMGKKISIAGTKKKQKIYKVHECKSYKESFASSSAKLAEQNTAG